MGIFIKRPLCLFCFCFIGGALFASLLGTALKISLFALLALITMLLFSLSVRIYKRKYGLIEAAVATTFASIAVLTSLLAIDLQMLRLERFVSESAPIEFVVCDKEYSSRYNTKYEGILLSTDKGKVNARAYLVLGDESDFEAGDKLLLVGDVKLLGSENEIFSLPSDTNIEITSTLDKDLIVKSSYDGKSPLVEASRLRASIRKIFLDRLDTRSAALSLGILTSDTSMLPPNVIRDFRRAGVSHLLAVSGLHLTVILGACEFLLMRFRLSKVLRCLVLTALSIVLITVSGFSLSACRSVLMLLVVYLCFAISREPDTLTSLSVAGMLILFFSPASVGSLSFWLSFLATLGIVLYSEVISSIHIKRHSFKQPIANRIIFALRKILGALIVTLSANVFICIIFFVFFGETSVISPLSNLTVTPLGEVYLVLTLFVLVFGKIPFLGTLVCKVTSMLASLMTSLAAKLSSFDFSVISLRYAFAGIIIGAITLALAIMFIVRLRDRRLLFTTPLLGVLAFCICLFVYNMANSQVKIAYVNEAARDAVAVADNGELTLIDVSDGTYSSLYNSYEWAKQNAFAEVETVLLTHYHSRHISTLDKLFGNVMVRKVFLPAPNDRDELNILSDILRLAKEHGVAAQIYEKGKLTNLTEKLWVFVLPDAKTDSSSKKIISFAIATREGILCYADASWHISDKKDEISVFVNNADALIFGAHGPVSKTNALMPQGFEGISVKAKNGGVLEFYFQTK